jgi:hypothetical protein
MAAMWMWAGLVWAADVTAQGILKQPNQPGCAEAWLMPTDPASPTPYCLDLSGLTAAHREAVTGYFDEELVIEGDYVEGALALRSVSASLGADNTELDYHLSTIAGSRSHDLARRLRDSTASKVRIQTPGHPISFELILQGVQTREQLPQVMEEMTFRLAGQPLMPETRSFGKTVVLVIPELPPRQLLTISTGDGQPLGGLLADALFSGEPESMSLTMLLSAL